MTSTLPLDYDGYDVGITNRPLALAEALRDFGLRTIAFSSSPWLSRTFAYDRGFEEFYELFDLDKFWIIFSNIYRKYFTGLLDKGVIDEKRFCEIIGRSFGRILAGLQNLCADKQREIEEGLFPDRVELHRHDFNAMQEALRKIASDFSDNTGEYIMKRMRNDLEADIRMFLLGKPTRGAVKAFLTKSADHLLKLLFVQLWRYEYSPPASYLSQRIISTVCENRNRPFFLWTHFLDIHDSTYISGPIGLPPNALSMVPGRLLTRSHPANVVRTFSLRFVDNHIAQIIATLKSQDLFESTLIVIAGDHGIHLKCPEEIGGNLFDESTHVPLIFYNPHIEPRTISEPCGLIDIAPTILDLLGKEPCPEFKGRSLICPLSSDYPVILESLGPGPCALRFKAIKMAVVRGKYKLIWREPGYEESCPAGANYLFDLETDPAEKNNLYSDQKYSKTISELESIVHERCAELRKRHRETGQTDEYLQ